MSIKINHDMTCCVMVCALGAQRELEMNQINQIRSTTQPLKHLFFNYLCCFCSLGEEYGHDDTSTVFSLSKSVHCGKTCHNESQILRGFQCLSYYCYAKSKI